MNLNNSANRTYLIITPDGRVKPGPDLSPDEATRAVVQQLGAQFSSRIAELEHEVEHLREVVQTVAESHSIAIGSQAALVSRKHNLEQLRQQARALLGIEEEV